MPCRIGTATCAARSRKFEGLRRGTAIFSPSPRRVSCAGREVPRCAGQRLRLDDFFSRLEPDRELPLLLPLARSLCAELFLLLARAPRLPLSERLMPGFELPRDLEDEEEERDAIENSFCVFAHSRRRRRDACRRRSPCAVGIGYPANAAVRMPQICSC